MKAFLLDRLAREGEIALVDDDPNWWTTRARLRQAIARGATSALVANVGWPHGRRDGYRDPALVPEEHRNASRRRGLKPFEDEPCASGGRHGALHNGVFPFGTRNGVLTAVEDFCGETGAKLALVPGFEPFAVVVPGEPGELARGLLDDPVRTLGKEGLFAAAAAARRQALGPTLARLKGAIARGRPLPSEALADAPVVVPLGGGDVLRDALRLSLGGHPLFAQLLRRVGAILDGARIAWAVVEGTLLGLERHAGFVPHDDDVDIAIAAEDLPRARETLEDAGLAMNEHVLWDGIGMTYAVGLEDPAARDLGLWPAAPAIDVFPVGRAANEILAPRELAACEPRPFLDFAVRAPKQARAVLRRRFGADALDVHRVWSREHGPASARAMTRTEYQRALDEEGFAAATTRPCE